MTIGEWIRYAIHPGSYCKKFGHSQGPAETRLIVATSTYLTRVGLPEQAAYPKRTGQLRKLQQRTACRRCGQTEGWIDTWLHEDDAPLRKPLQRKLIRDGFVVLRHEKNAFNFKGLIPHHRRQP